MFLYNVFDNHNKNAEDKLIAYKDIEDAAKKWGLIDKHVYALGGHQLGKHKSR